MAIDTPEKRRSISGIPLLIPGVTPNAAKDAEWRRQVANTYSLVPAGADANAESFIEGQQQPVTETGGMVPY